MKEGEKKMVEWMIQGILWLLILAACFWIVRRRFRKWQKGEYCDCCDGSCGGCGKRSIKK